MTNKLGAGGHPRVARDRSPWAYALRARREALGLSTYAAARALGVSQSSVSMAETGSWRITKEQAEERLAAYDAWAAIQQPGPGDGLDAVVLSAAAPEPRRPHRRAAIR